MLEVGGFRRCLPYPALPNTLSSWWLSLKCLDPACLGDEDRTLILHASAAVLTGKAAKSQCRDLRSRAGQPTAPELRTTLAAARRSPPVPFRLQHRRDHRFTGRRLVSAQVHARRAAVGGVRATAHVE
jgi:hypothetical protein